MDYEITKGNQFGLVDQGNGMEFFLMIYDGSMDHYSPVLLSIGVQIILLASLGGNPPQGAPHLGI